MTGPTGPTGPTDQTILEALARYEAELGPDDAIAAVAMALEVDEERVRDVAVAKIIGRG